MDTFTHHFCTFEHGGAIEYKYPTMYEDCEYILSLTHSLRYFPTLGSLIQGETTSPVMEHQENVQYFFSVFRDFWKSKKAKKTGKGKRQAVFFMPSDTCK